ncbi:MAG: hypothetical protein EZS28_000735 [Streblomastix strix]|uniref:Vps52 coiled-coil domain-containing protein n=1 Tax=Streblomastix strix TaxID=222440 RepID=A0A5J4XB77_9EUKA|nr:MAG: hypothetical protein EZS28_000735 [Streblomastix strix]
MMFCALLKIQIYIQSFFKIFNISRGILPQLEREIHQIESKSVEVYFKEEKLLFELHDDIKDCDTVLKQIQELLLDFQKNLSGLTSEIRELQNQTGQLNTQLKNRRTLSHEFSSFLSRITVPDDVSQSIESGPMKIQYQQFSNYSPSILSAVARMALDAVRPL